MKKTGLVIFLLVLLISNFAIAQTEIKDLKVEKGGTLTFGLNNADIRSVLRLFAKYMKVNIVAGDDVKGKVTLSFTKVHPKEGFEAVLRALGYDWFQEGDVIVVSAKRTVKTYILQYANAEELKDTLDLLAEPGDTVSVNSSYNALVVKTWTDNIGRIEKAIKDMDIPPKQVMIEAKILEIKNSDIGNMGLDVKYTSPDDPNDVAETLNLAGRATDDNPLGFYAKVLAGDVESYFSSVDTQVGYDIIASPKICTLNHKNASILIGAKLGYKTAVITETGTIQEVKFIQTGTSLNFTPHIGDEGFIRVSIEPKVSEGYLVDEVPQENTTETKNEVLVKDGQTIVIGGLFRIVETQTDKGIPFLMDIPFLGALFRRTDINNEKRELLIFVTPHILTPEYLEKLDADGKEFEERVKRQKSTFLH